MKRIIIEMDDSTALDMTALSPIIAVARSFRVDTVEEARRQAPRVKNFKPGGGMTAFQELMSHYTPDGIFQKTAAQSWLMEKGWAKGTVSSALSYLGAQKYIRNLGSGKFQFLKPMAEGAKLGARPSSNVPFSVLSSSKGD